MMLMVIATGMNMLVVLIPAAMLNMIVQFVVITEPIMWMTVMMMLMMMVMMTMTMVVIRAPIPWMAMMMMLMMLMMMLSDDNGGGVEHDDADGDDNYDYGDVEHEYTDGDDN